jgi:hypothetical protein
MSKPNNTQTTMFDSYSVEDIRIHAEANLKAATTPKTDLAAILKELRVNTTDELKPPEKAWVQIINGEEIILGTLGNFSMLIGKAKSRKSFLINMILTVILSSYVLRFGQFKSLLPADKQKTLYFDTEQGGYHVQLALKRICKQIGQDEPKNIEVYKLRSKTPAERLALIEYAIYNTPNLGFVVIDGIKDLITSINDEQEATMVSSKLLKWTEELNIHIVVVLHKNKTNNDARGHIGSELLNKAETVLSVTKSTEDKDISIVESQESRNTDAQQFAFEIDKDGLPKIIEDFKVRTAPSKNKIDVDLLSGREQWALVESVYEIEKEFLYGELTRQFQVAFKERYNKPLGTNAAKGFISYFKKKAWVLQGKTKDPYTKGKFTDDVDQYLE